MKPGTCFDRMAESFGPLACLLVLLVACPAVHAQQASTIVVKVDWASLLARHDLVWNRLPTEWYEAPFLGNGLLGTQVRRKSDTHTDEMLLVAEAEPAGGEVGCRFRFHPEEAIAPRMKTGRRMRSGYVPNPPLIVSEVDGIGLCVQDLLRGGQTATAWRAEPNGNTLTLRARSQSLCEVAATISRRV